MEKIVKIRPDLSTLEDVRQELKTELLNALLFANDDVIRCLSEFIREPSHGLYLRTVTAMRKDLWGKTTKITEKDVGALI